MLGRRRVFAVEPRGSRDWAGEDLAVGCVVPGITSTYRRIQDAADWSSSDLWNGESQLRGLGRQVPLLKPASRDSGVEMVVGDSYLATLPGLSQDSLDFEPAGSSEPPSLPDVEPPAQPGQLLASRKLEQVLEQSRQLPTSLASVPRQHRALQPPSKLEYEVPHFGAREQEATETETGTETGLQEAEVRGLEPEVWASLPGQGLRYLEHLCLVLEQMARLQQLYLQLQTQRLLGDPGEEEESTLAPSPSPSHAPGNELLVSCDLHSLTKETGSKAASFPKVGVPSANPPDLPKAPTQPTHTFPSSQGYKDKVKVLLNRIAWKSSRHPEPPAPPNDPVPRIESRELPERPQCRHRRKTFLPSLVVKKQRAKNLSAS